MTDAFDGPDAMDDRAGSERPGTDRPEDDRDRDDRPLDDRAPDDRARTDDPVDDRDRDARFDDDDEDEVRSEDVRAVEELLAYVARALVDDPDEVEVHSVEGDKSLVFELIVSQRDLGKVIGREGRTARALRTMLNASSARLGKRAILEILE